MNYLLEAVFVGLYTQFLYLLLSSVVNEEGKWFLFCLGFLKHLAGDVLGLHTYYCNNGDACTNCDSDTSDSETSKKVSNRTNLMILIECIGEGGLFYFVGSALYTFVPYFLKHRLLSVFLIGFSLHIVFELVGFHYLFCKYRCSLITRSIK